MTNPKVSSHDMQGKVFIPERNITITHKGNSKLFLIISYQYKTSQNIRTVFLMSRKAVSSIIIDMDIVRLCTFASPLATSRHTLKSIKEYLLGRVKLSQIHHIAVYCKRDYVNLVLLTFRKKIPNKYLRY